MLVLELAVCKLCRKLEVRVGVHWRLQCGSLEEACWLCGSLGAFIGGVGELAQGGTFSFMECTTHVDGAVYQNSRHTPPCCSAVVCGIVALDICSCWRWWSCLSWSLSSHGLVNKLTAITHHMQYCIKLQHAWHRPIIRPHGRFI
jgi:hypothetical protein